MMMMPYPMQYSPENWGLSANLSNQCSQMNGMGKLTTEEFSKKDDNSFSQTQIKTYCRFDNDMLPTTETSLQ